MKTLEEINRQKDSEHEKILARLKRRSLWRWLRAVAMDWGMIALALTIARAAHHPVIYFLAVFVIGTRQHALALMAHEGGHRLICRTRWLNDLLAGLFCFWPLGQGIQGYRKFHFTHHAYVGTEQDPELTHKRLRTPQWDLPAAKLQIGGYFVKDMLGLSFMEIIPLMRTIPPAGLLDVSGALVWWTAALSMAVWTHFYGIIILWFAALGTSFWAVFRLRVWTEHIGTAGAHRISVSWWQRWIFVPHNTWVHWEHHRWPSIPCHNLPQARLLNSREPVIPLNKLFDAYQISEKIPSGTPLK